MVLKNVNVLLSLARALPFEQWLAQESDPEFQIAKKLRKAEFYDGIETRRGLSRYGTHVATTTTEEGTRHTANDAGEKSERMWLPSFNGTLPFPGSGAEMHIDDQHRGRERCLVVN
jgi:hypothetical protein